VTEISVADLKRKRDAGDSFVLLDVREPDERETAAIDGIVAIPMMEIPGRYAELPQDTDIVVMCHHGGRSARVTQFLNDHGYARAVNLDGGINAWSEQIDPAVPKY
jgi:rhodanese-related sulfurtransferase